VMYGNNVSHAHNKTRRRFDINLLLVLLWAWLTLLPYITFLPVTSQTLDIF
jgi:ribosomal protein L28